MVHYRKAPKRPPIDPAKMKEAFERVRAGMSFDKAAKATGLSSSTIQRYAVAVSKNPAAPLTFRFNTRQVFSPKDEEEFKTYLMTCSLMFYGLTKEDFKVAAYSYAKTNNVKYPDSWNKESRAGDNWYLGFMSRHKNDMSLRTPEGCSLSRATSFNRNIVGKFFDNLWALYQRYPKIVENLRIYNLDEKGLVTVQNPKKIIAPKGVKQSCKVTSAERGTLVTICCIIAASGTALLPIMVFPRVNFKPSMKEGAPPGTLGLACKSGWMNSDLFPKAMEHFIAKSGSSKDNPSILIYDNHESHLSAPAISLPKEKGVHILTVPPHSTNKLQLLDVGVYSPFQTYYDGALDTWMSQHPGQTFDICNVGTCAGLAHARSMTPLNIMHAFQKTGIYPFDRHIFTDADFMSSRVTDRHRARDVRSKLASSSFRLVIFVCFTLFSSSLNKSNLYVSVILKLQSFIQTLFYLFRAAKCCPYIQKRCVPFSIP